MDLPIKVMVTLTVALSVAVMLLFFANDVIDDAKRKMLDLREDPPIEKIVDKGTSVVVSSEIVYLAEDCIKQHAGEGLTTEMCYVVRGNIDLTRTALETAGLSDILNYDSNLIDLSFTGNSLFIYYNGLKRTVEIRN